MLIEPFCCVAGGILMGLQFPVNLGRWANSVSIWLGIQPYELFFYIFLPPLLFDAAVRIDFYLFKKVCLHAMFSHDHDMSHCLHAGRLLSLIDACS